MRNFELKYERPVWMPEDTAWDSLSVYDKTDIMKACIENNISSIEDIRTAYNNYAAGRNILEGIPDYSKKATEFGNFLAGGGVKYGKPYYSYDENGRRADDTLNYNATLPEVTIIPDSRKSPSQRNEDERYRQRFLGDYAGQKNRDYTIRQHIAAQRNWENSAEKKALDFGIAAAQGVGMGADIASTALGGLPVYSGLKGAQALDRAVSSGDAMDYMDAGLWLSPMLTVEGKRVYNAVKPAVQRVFQKGTPAAEWAEAGSLTRSAAERGRNIMLDWIGSPFYKQRWQSAAPYEDVNPIIKDMAENTRLQQFNYRDRSALSNDGLTNGSTYSTSIKPDITITGDKTIRDYNTGFSIDLASDLGDKATSTSIHELSHLTSGMSGGLEPVIRYGKPIYGSMIEPVKSDYPLINETLIPRGKRYQHFMVDYNDGLLPQESTLLRDVFNNPQQAKESLMGIGRTSEEADQLISALKNSYSYLWNKQEQQAFLKQMFFDDVRPHLNNPNDAKEIERFLIMNPDVLDNNPQVKTIMEVIRPGDIKRYAKYLAESLSVLPFINNSNKHQQ